MHATLSGDVLLLADSGISNNTGCVSPCTFRGVVVSGADKSIVRMVPPGATALASKPLAAKRRAGVETAPSVPTYGGVLFQSDTTKLMAKVVVAPDKNCDAGSLAEDAPLPEDDDAFATTVEGTDTPLDGSGPESEILSTVINRSPPLLEMVVPPAAGSSVWVAARAAPSCQVICIHSGG